jgi:large subunit ribosomal protein L18
MGAISRRKSRLKRKKRVRKTVKGTSKKPRLSIFRSAKHIYAQIIDDDSSTTLVSASSMSADFKTEAENSGGNCKGAAIVGEKIAKKAVEKGIKRVVFDRNGFLYHGRVKSLADAAREHGLDF